MKKFTRTLLALTLTLIMIVASMLTASAKELPQETTIRVNETWGYTVIEKETASGSVRIIYNNSQEIDSTDDNRIKSLLIDLGMRADIVNNLPETSLRNYADCRMYTNTINYCEIDDSEYLDSDSNGNPRSSNTGYSQYNGITLEINFIVAELNGYSGRFIYTVESNYSSLPIARLTDSLGACAQVSAIVPGTKFAYYSYYETDQSGSSPVTTNHTGVLTNYADPSYGSWNGSAVRFTLPSDTYGYDDDGSTYLEKYISNYSVHYEFQMVLNYPTLPTNFNAYASYTHTYISYINQDVSITTSGNSASIGLNIGFGISRNRYTTSDMLIQYTP